ncbi:MULTISPECIES: TadE/TadG family type IV pilus assembly protein [Modestobacter]|jgi:Flp pilus assembly protein TadG|uniref:Pilus assembly protein TadE n=1 Tax=Modestobacter caceresii TaxID=1522368 RepID=A0A098Y9V9_9ACTN|nr:MULTISPECIES: TadE/TadG family type IV pilus assembly protein [Modestobacter]KGH47259.1 pilus assembly protein TadE [Modestobacter caceresii]
MVGRRLRDERGASAVEFAMIVPLLIALVLGIAEFGHAFSVQGTLSAAAREGARAMALQNDQAAARTAVRGAAATLDPDITDAQITITPASCPLLGGIGSSTYVSVTISYPKPYLTGFFGSGLSLSAKGVMRCNG